MRPGRSGVLTRGRVGVLVYNTVLYMLGLPATGLEGTGLWNVFFVTCSALALFFVPTRPSFNVHVSLIL